ncbi:MAG: Lysyl-tRNA synthetase [Microgenomates bacterium 39_7]|nr:MAG: Lysyl-tRNA synthetase [Microgenomates bacterium 39_7]
MTSTLPSREKSQELLSEYIKNEALQEHCRLVAKVMEAYAAKFGEDSELWYQTGLLHDLDWEMYPDEHPNVAVNDLLSDYPEELLQAVKAHATFRTGFHPSSRLDKYLFACDELVGFLHAYSLMRPDGFAGMKAGKVKKKLKDKSFAANVSREDIEKGFKLIEQDPAQHISFLVEVLTN